MKAEIQAAVRELVEHHAGRWLLQYPLILMRQLEEHVHRLIDVATVGDTHLDQDPGRRIGQRPVQQSSGDQFLVRDQEFLLLEDTVESTLRSKAIRRYTSVVNPKPEKWIWNVTVDKRIAEGLSNFRLRRNHEFETHYQTHSLMRSPDFCPETAPCINHPTCQHLESPLDARCRYRHRLYDDRPDSY